MDPYQHINKERVQEGMKKMTDIGLHAVKKSDRIDGKLVPNNKRYSIYFDYDENLEKATSEFVKSFSEWLGEDSDVVLWKTSGWVEYNGFDFKEEENDTRQP